MLNTVQNIKKYTTSSEDYFSFINGKKAAVSFGFIVGW